MGNKTVSQLPAAGSAALTDLYEVEQSGVSKKETLLQMQSAMTGKQDAVAYTSTHFGFFTITNSNHVYTNNTGKPVFIEFHLNAIIDPASSIVGIFIFRGSDLGIEWRIGMTIVAGTVSEFDAAGTRIVSPGDTLTFEAPNNPGPADLYRVEYFQTSLF
jgi:hypothetical protein